MQPTLNEDSADSELVLVERWGARLGRYTRGDVVVLRCDFHSHGYRTHVFSAGPRHSLLPTTEQAADHVCRQLCEHSEGPVVLAPQESKSAAATPYQALAGSGRRLDLCARACRNCKDPQGVRVPKQVCYEPDMK